MRVLVTGGAGYIGSHACAALADAGHSPIVLDNLRTGHRWATQWGPFEYGDILDTVRLCEVIKRHRPDAVMHFAALAYVGESVTEPDAYYRTNVSGTLNLLQAMRTFGIEKLVFSSTCAVYGAASPPIDESSPLAPVNPYGRTKKTAESMIADHASAYGIGAICLRYFNAAGADAKGRVGEEHDPEPHLIPLVLQTALGLRSHVDVYGDDYETPDGTCVRDYVHVADLAEAHVSGLQACVAGECTPLNLGTGVGYSVAEVIDAVQRVTGRKVRTRKAPRRTGDPPILIASPARAAAALSWRAHVSELEGMLESAWRWMTEHRANVGLPRLGGA